MPRDLIEETQPDLSAPSLPGLEWLLRNPAAWPSTYRWDFRDVLRDEACGTAGCALGLAALVWPEERRLLHSEFPGEAAAAVFNICTEAAYDIFIDGVNHMKGDNVTPDKVAARIQAYLALMAD